MMIGYEPGAVFIARDGAGVLEVMVTGIPLDVVSSYLS